jgi:hypothetical protein
MQMPTDAWKVLPMEIVVAACQFELLSSVLQLFQDSDGGQQLSLPCTLNDMLCAFFDPLICCVPSSWFLLWLCRWLKNLGFLFHLRLCESTHL